MKRLTVLLIAAVLVLGISACGRSEQKEDTANEQNTEGEAENVTVSASPKENEVSMMEIPKSFVLIEGGTFFWTRHSGIRMNRQGHHSGGTTLDEDISQWLDATGIRPDKIC